MIMDVTRVIKRWEKPLKAKIKGDGHYVKGKWVQGDLEKDFVGTFLPLTPKDLQFSESGVYTTQDKKLYILNDIKDSEGNPLKLSEGDIIVDNAEEYEIKDELEAAEAVNYRKFIAKKKVVS